MKLPLSLPLLISACLFSMSAYGQASYATYGYGCGNRGEPPVPAQIIVMGTPRLGTTIDISWNGPTFTRRYSVLANLVTGLSRTSYFCQPLPIHIPSWMLNFTGENCELWCSVEAMEILGTRNSIPIDIPLNSHLIGLKLYHQWYLRYVVTGSFLDVFTLLSDGGEMTIGL